jgi:hypothetical protein
VERLLGHSELLQSLSLLLEVTRQVLALVLNGLLVTHGSEELVLEFRTLSVDHDVNDRNWI